jgi:sugar lactone lactonase YvrE
MVYAFGDGTLLAQIFQPTHHDIWQRFLVFAFVVGFALYAHSILNKYKETAVALQASEEKYRYPNDIVLDENGRLYIVDRENNRVQVRPISPGVNAGTNVGAPVDDIDNDPRPQGGFYDMGSDEVIQ